MFVCTSLDSLRGAALGERGIAMSGMRGGVIYALAVALAASVPSPARAQTQTQADLGSAQISERVRRDAESPMRWIKIHSENARQAEEAKTAAAAAAAATARRPAAKTVAAPAPARAAADASAATQAANATPPQQAAAIKVPEAFASPTPPEDTPEAALISIDRVDPEWDDELLRTLRKGRVVVRFHVAEDGYLSRMQIVESTHSKLTGPAMAAVMQWRFEPLAEPRTATVEFGFDTESGRH